MVGCVIARGTRVIGEGWHRRFGGPHAEIDALRRCTQSPRGADVYVTLEPCCFHGKTPPCTQALMAAGVRRVIAAAIDPNPRVRGRGLEQLRAAGIEVHAGVLAAEAQALLAPYAKWMCSGRPWVILKWAQSLDGKLATRTGDARWISDEVARRHAHRTRGRVDAILVGVNTVLADDPLLTCRAGRPKRVATRVVLDSRLRTPPACRLVETARQTPTLIVTAPEAPQSRADRLLEAGCQVQRVPRRGAGLSLAAVLDDLGRRQMTYVLVEGGGRLLGSFLDEKLADELHIYIAPLLIGGRTAVGALDGAGPARLADAWRLPPDVRMRRLGHGWFLQARLPGRPTVRMRRRRSVQGG